MSSKVVEIQSELNGIIEKLLCNGVNKSEVQDKYILPPNERPQMSEVCCYSENIPVVDLKDLDGPKRSRVVEEIRRACEEDGFFQVHNPFNALYHGHCFRFLVYHGQKIPLCLYSLSMVYVLEFSSRIGLFFGEILILLFKISLFTTYINSTLQKKTYATF